MTRYYSGEISGQFDHAPERSDVGVPVLRRERRTSPTLFDVPVQICIVGGQDVASRAIDHQVLRGRRCGGRP